MQTHVLSKAPQHAGSPQHLPQPEVWKSLRENLVEIDVRSRLLGPALDLAVQTSMIRLHDQLMAFPKYCELLDELSNDNGELRNWQSKRILEDTDARLSVLAICNEQPVPLHDHPGSRGAFLVLRGSVQVRQFGLVEAEKLPSNNNLVSLHHDADTTVEPMQVSVFGKHRGNIHGLVSCSPVCIMLNFRLRSDSEQLRSWYFATEHHDTGSKYVSARRVSARYL